MATEEVVFFYLVRVYIKKINFFLIVIDITVYIKYSFKRSTIKPSSPGTAICNLIGGNYATSNNYCKTSRNRT